MMTAATPAPERRASRVDAYAEPSAAAPQGRFWAASKGVLIAILAFVYMVPVIVLILTSFKTQVQVMSTTPTWIFMPTLMNYHTVLMEQGFLRYMTNSLIVGLVSTLFTLVVGGCAS